MTNRFLIRENIVITKHFDFGGVDEMCVDYPDVKSKFDWMIDQGIPISIYHHTKNAKSFKELYRSGKYRGHPLTLDLWVDIDSDVHATLYKVRWC
jgi:hypothetical protein